MVTTPSIKNIYCTAAVKLERAETGLTQFMAESHKFPLIYKNTDHVDLPGKNS